MTTQLARDALTVFVGGDETPGLIFYGLAEPGVWADVGFPNDAWPSSPEPDVLDLEGNDWHVHGWELPIIIWPTGSGFQAAAHQTLGALIRGGCRIAWIGAEGIPFCDPPRLFDPECMSGGVLAWMTDDGRFDCPLNPDDALAPVSDNDLRILQSHAQGVANRPCGHG